MPLRFSALKLVTGPTIEPVSLDEAKLQLKIRDWDEEDDYITSLITVAREWAEDYTSRAFNTQSWKVGFSAWSPDRTFILPRPPLVSVESFKYQTVDGVVTVDPTDYSLDLLDTPGAVTLSSEFSMPALTVSVRHPITVEFTAGYGDLAADVPSTAKQAILLCVANWFENRIPVIIGQGFTATKVPLSAETLLKTKLRLRQV